jgi:S-adenosylmethionine:tRNA ribosyltransferase-isomerase
MRLSDLDFPLPERLIAQEPAATREAARLLTLGRQSGAVGHGHIPDLVRLLRAGDLLVVNDTKVRPARLFARRATGGAVELLLVEPAPSSGAGVWRSMLQANRPVRVGERLRLTDGSHDLAGSVRLEGRDATGLWLVAPEEGDLAAWMEAAGRLPLPPYIRRSRDDARTALDRERYQTVFAREPGAVAAPTAGLHLTHDLLAALEARGVRRAAVTLHVGLGTFQPVKVDDLTQHRMHAEAYVVPAETAEQVRRTKAEGGRVVAVGTTSLRTLEAAALTSPDGLPRAGAATTDLFILPGFAFRVVDALLTNFHLPRSTLLALVAAFAGLERVHEAYRQAVLGEYRFFSYGDAMFVA